MQVGVNVAIGPDGPPTHDEVVAEVRAAAGAGLATAWWPQLPPVPGIAPWDALTSIAATAVAVEGIGLGTSVVVSYARHPLALATQALTVQAVSGNRLTLGIGTSHAAIVEGAYGLPFDRPARHLREYLEALGPALRGEPVDYHGETTTAVGTVAIPGATAPSVVLAALGPVMLRLAGELADGTIATWGGPRAIGDVIVPGLSAAAAAAGRGAPRVIVNALGERDRRGRSGPGLRRRAVRRRRRVPQLPADARPRRLRRPGRRRGRGRRGRRGRRAPPLRRRRRHRAGAVGVRPAGGPRPHPGPPCLWLLAVVAYISRE